MFGSLGKIQLSILALILANIIWGAAFPIFKWTLEVIPTFTFVFIRFFGGALLILPFIFKSLKITKTDIPKLILVSIIGVTIQIPLIFFGLKLSPSINAPIIIASGPIILIIASIIFLNEKLRLKVLAGTLISLIGVLAIILRPIIETGGLTGGVLGNFLIFGATLCSVAQALLLKKITVNNDPLTITFWMFLIGVIPIIPLVLIEAQTFNFVQDINIQGFIGLFYGVIFAAVLAHYLWTYGVKYIKASEVGIFSYVDPVATIVVAVPLLGESITPVYIAATILVFFGIFIAEGRIPYHPLQKLKSNL
ncbi:MAG: DMT family transporter [Candidatus Levybacteria bacterium]|nr:DMT family transporter [Candidatus Levybacteria bacterium]